MTVSDGNAVLRVPKIFLLLFTCQMHTCSSRGNNPARKFVLPVLAACVYLERHSLCETGAAVMLLIENEKRNYFAQEIDKDISLYVIQSERQFRKSINRSVNSTRA